MVRSRIRRCGSVQAKKVHVSTMKPPIDPRPQKPVRGSSPANEAAKIIDALKAQAFDDYQGSAPDELLQVALRAAAAVKEVNDETPWAFYGISPHSENWPILYNEVADLRPYRSLKIGHQLLQTKNPKKRGAGSGLFAFLAKELIARLETLWLMALMGPNFDPTARDKLILPLAENHQRRNLSTAGSDLPQKTLADFHQRIASHTPTWVDSLKTLGDFNAETSGEWKKHGQKLFREVFPRPEKIPELRRLILDAEAQKYDSVIRTRIVFRVGKAIASAAIGLEPDL